MVLQSGTTLASAGWSGYTWSASRLEGARPVASLAFNLTPRPPYRTYTVTVLLEAEVDEGEPTIAYTYPVAYPYSWAIIVDDECRVLGWEPVAEPTASTTVLDTRPPAIGEEVVTDPRRVREDRKHKPC